MALPLGAWAQEAALLTLVAPDGRRIVLDAAAMDALPQQELRTRTVWTEGPQTFGGVALRDVLALAGSEADLKPRTLVLHALNDYEITVPAADAWSFPVSSRAVRTAARSAAATRGRSGWCIRAMPILCCRISATISGGSGSFRKS